MNWLDLLWTVVIYGLIFGILWWAVNYFKSQIPQPFAMILTVILIAAIVVVSIGILIGNVPLMQFGQVGQARLR
jgi:ABC-type branched-subunit amino acid transport system permease subunit